MKKKVLIITTGGTISMRYDAELGIIPDNNLVDLLANFPQLTSAAEIEVFEFSNMPSPHVTPQRMFELAKMVDNKISDYDGVVITHGTDTLEETAYMLDLVLTTRKPVIFTAAMRSGSELGLDGPRNIVGAVRVAVHHESIDKGVLVVMNDEIHTARDVVKADTGKLESFVSPNFGILGIVDTDRVVYHRKLLFRENVWTNELDYNIDLIKAVAGMDGRYIESSIANDAKGIVIEAFGRGNLPLTMIEPIRRAIARDIVVVITSRVFKGRVLPEYGYEGGGFHLKKLGVILGEDLKGVKARIKLMALFGKYKEPALVRKNFTFVYE
ncbi:MAG: asparaginase [Candidatus Cloacimonetes bacterium]|nr:asparaginase [Candidatus Cloacimonadota bacterium]